MAIELQAEPRTLTGKKVRFLRRESIIPVVIYGGGVSEPINAQVNERELGEVLQRAGGANLIDLNLGGRTVPTLARAVQYDDLRKRIIHVDFQAVRMDQTVAVDVQVRLVGEAPIVEDENAIVTQALESVVVEALPRDLVGHVELDISGLTEVGMTLHVSDIKLPETLTLMTDPALVVVTTSLPAAELVEEEVTETEVEPELVGEAEDGAAEDEDEGAADEE